MTVKWMDWEPEPDVCGYVAAIAAPDGNLLAEAIVTESEVDGSATYEVLGRDGLTVLAEGGADTVEAACMWAEHEMRRSIIRVA